MRDIGKYFHEERNWVVVYDTGVSYRSSKDYDDRAAGRGPNTGEKFITAGPPEERHGTWFIKVQPTGQSGTWMYLPCNTTAGRPVMRPEVMQSVEAKLHKFRVVYPKGVGTRKSNFYGDRDLGDDGGSAKIFDQGEEFTGWVVDGGTNPDTGVRGPQMVKVKSDAKLVYFVPVTTESGKKVLEVMEDVAPATAPATAPGMIDMNHDGIDDRLQVPQTGFGAPPGTGFGMPPGTGYPPQQPTGWGAPATGFPPQQAPAAPQPEWTAHQAGNGRTYWANTRTKATTWEDPYAVRQAPAPQPATPQWQVYYNNGRPYWSNGSETTWTDPTPWSGPFYSQGKPYWSNTQTQVTTWNKPY